MLASIKPLIVVLIFATLVYRVVTPIALKFSSESDFFRRRNVWFILTITAMLSPSFWLFVLVAVPLLIAAGRKDRNPVALYLLLLHVVTPVQIDIPFVGIESLFGLDIYRLLSLCVLIPAAWRYRSARRTAAAPSGFGAPDFFLIASGLLIVALYVPADLPGHVLQPDSLTNMLRRAFLFVIDAYVVYFTISRWSSNRQLIAEALAAYCVSCAIMAVLALFETAWGWKLYAHMAETWTGNARASYYLLRGTHLRAEVSTRHALALAYLLAVAFGFWLYLKSRVPSVWARIAGICVYWAGLLVTYSRGPWIGAASILMVFTVLRPRALSRLLKTAAAIAIGFGAVLVSPLGDQILSVLPWMGGSVGSDTLLYRQRIAQRSWHLIASHPFLGDQLALLKMEDLRQGEGIIDLVNTYATVALFYGLVGLFAFLAFILIPAFRAYLATRRVAQSDPDLALLGASLIACTAGTLVMLADSSFILAYQQMFYVLAGLTAAYARLGQVPAPQPRAASELAPMQQQR